VNVPRDHPPTNGISVVVPVHNNVALILETLTSVDRSLEYLRERDSGHCHLPCDIVVVDDGSTDGTHDIVSGFARGRPDYTVIRRDALSNASGATPAWPPRAATSTFFLKKRDRSDIHGSGSLIVDVGKRAARSWWDCFARL
jgi:glycosyltransferase involved in cell wall biosynthesis